MSNGIEEQLSLNLHDDIQQVESYYDILSKKTGSNTNIYIFKSWRRKDVFFLGTRTFYYETEYTKDYTITREQAEYIYNQKSDVYEFCDCLKK